MEALPRMPMLAFQLKNCSEIITPLFTGCIKEQISKYYHEDGNRYSKECTELEQLRDSAIKVSRDFMGCSTLKKYYAQLQFVCSRMKFADDDNTGLTFTWDDAYTGKAVESSDIHMEQAAILYNIGALHSILGAMDNRQNPEGMKVSCTHFQCAAWAFQHVRDFYSSMGSICSDMDHELLNFQINLMLAQAQECILEKSMTDNRKSSITAKVAAQIMEYYATALKHLEACDPSNRVGSKRYKEWKKRLDLKRNFHQCIVYYYLGCQVEDQQKWGERVTYFKAAVEKLNDCIKLAKGDDSEITESLRFTMDVVGGKYNAAKKDNDFVYHEKIPEIDSLPEVKGAQLVKGIPFNPNDPEISGPDIFKKLVPMKAHEAASLYSEEKAKLLREVCGEIEEKDAELLHYEQSLQLEPSKIYPEVEPLPQVLLEKCAAISVKPEAIQDLISSMLSLSGISTEVETNIKEILDMLEEDEKSAKEIQEVIGHRAPDVTLGEIRKECLKYKEGLSKASQSNEELHKAMSTHISNLRILSGPLDELQKALPSVEIQSPEDEAIISEMKRLMGKVDEMRDQRVQLEDQLRRQIQEDDITNALVTREDGDLDDFFTAQLKKHDQLSSLIRQNLSAQANILRALTDTNAKYADIRRQIEEAKIRKKSMVDNLIQSYDVYEDLLAKCQKGVDFYKKLELNVQRLLERTQRVCKVHGEERQNILDRLKPKAPPPSRPTAPKPGSDPSTSSATPAVHSGMSPAAMAAAAGAAMGYMPGALPLSTASAVPGSVPGMPPIDHPDLGPLPDLPPDPAHGTPRLTLKDYLPFMKPATFGNKKKREVAPVEPSVPPPLDPATMAAFTAAGIDPKMIAMYAAGGLGQVPNQGQGQSLPSSHTGSPVHVARQPASQPASPAHLPQNAMRPQVSAGGPSQQIPPNSMGHPQAAMHIAPSSMPGVPPTHYNMPNQPTGTTGPAAAPPSSAPSSLGGALGGPVAPDHVLSPTSAPGAPTTRRPFAQGQLPQASGPPADPTGQSVAYGGHNFAGGMPGSFQVTATPPGGPAAGSQASHQVAAHQIPGQPSTSQMQPRVPSPQIPEQQQPQQQLSVQPQQQIPTQQQHHQPQFQQFQPPPQSHATAQVSQVASNYPTPATSQPTTVKPPQPQGYPTMPQTSTLSGVGPSHQQIPGTYPQQFPAVPSTVGTSAASVNQSAVPQSGATNFGPQSGVYGNQPGSGTPNVSQYAMGAVGSQYNVPASQGQVPRMTVAGQQPAQQPPTTFSGQNYNTGAYPGYGTGSGVVTSQSVASKGQSHPQMQSQGQSQPQIPGQGQGQRQMSQGQGQPHMPGQGQPQMPGQGQPQMSGQGQVQPQMLGQGQGQPQIPGQGQGQMPGQGQGQLQMPGQGQRQSQMAGQSQGQPQRPGQGQPQIPGRGQGQPGQFGQPRMPYSSSTTPQPSTSQYYQAPVSQAYAQDIRPNSSTSAARTNTQYPAGYQTNQAQVYLQAGPMNATTNVSSQGENLPTSKVQGPLPVKSQQQMGSTQPSSSGAVSSSGAMAAGSAGATYQPQNVNSTGPQQQKFGVSQPGGYQQYPQQQQNPAGGVRASSSPSSAVTGTAQGQGQSQGQYSQSGFQTSMQGVAHYSQQYQSPMKSQASGQTNTGTQFGYQKMGQQPQQPFQQPPSANQPAQTGSQQQPTRASQQEKPLNQYPPQQGTPANQSYYQQHPAVNQHPNQARPPASFSQPRQPQIPPQNPILPSPIQPTPAPTPASMVTSYPSPAPTPNPPSQSATPNMSPLPQARMQPPLNYPERASSLPPVQPTNPQTTPQVGSMTPKLQHTTSSSLDDILSSSPESSKDGAAHPNKDVLTPKVITEEDIQRQKEEKLKNSLKQTITRDPYTDKDVLDRFVSEVEKFEKLVDGLTKETLSGPTPVDREWKELAEDQEKEARKHSMAIARCYPLKNRFSDIMPYDNTRVVLTGSTDDYINASHLGDLSVVCPKFIATQAPLPATMVDFWQLVHEQGSEVIVSLCIEHEAGKKNHIYWPNEKGKTINHGPYSIYLQGVKEKQGWVESILTLTHRETRQSRSVVHLQFLQWPPGGVPSSPAQLLQFACEVHSFYIQQRNLVKPVVVHCSNGVDRTGAFCVIYTGIQEICQGHGIVNVVDLVKRLRQKRKYMVGEKELLRFCYHSILYFGQDLLMKRGILTNRKSFGDKLPAPGDKSGHQRKPSEDFILGMNMNLNTIQSSVAKMTVRSVSPSHGDGSEPRMEQPQLSQADILSNGVTPSAVAQNSSTVIPQNQDHPLNQQQNIIAPLDASENVQPMHFPTNEQIFQGNRSRSGSTASVQSTNSMQGRSSHSASPSKQLGKVNISNLPPSLADLQDPNTFKLEVTPPSKRKITKASFINQEAHIGEVPKEPGDPLADLDPLWSIKGTGSS